jgi:hypothetical protein
MMFNKGQLLMLSDSFEQIIAPYMWIEFLILLVTSLDKSFLELFNSYNQIIWYNDSL